MKKLLALLAAVVLGTGVCSLLRADDAPPPGAPATAFDSNNAYLWGVEHTAAIAKDPDASGVQAVLSAAELLRSQPPQVQLDYFNKALFDTKNRAVQREIRVQLYKLYAAQGQSDKALDQLQQLMLDD